jgi:hypothetical protein
VHNAAQFVTVPVRDRRRARVTFGTLGLILLFGLGYRIGVRRSRPALP